MFPRIYIHPTSFWVGFVAGVIFWWIVTRLRELLPRFRAYLARRLQEIRQRLTASTEVRLCNDTLRMTQNMHLAAPLFTLDEIIITPRVFTCPPPEVESSVSVDITSATIPYLPEWPEMAAAFNIPTLTLPEVMQGGANIILMGNPGYGKTVALAHFANLVARRDPEAGQFANFIPLLVHAADFTAAHLSSKSPAEALTSIVSAHVSTLTLPRLPDLIANALLNQRALILLDGLDEFPPHLFKQYVTFLEVVLKKYPGTRIVVAANPDFYDGLNQLGFIPVALATWGEAERRAFLDRWHQMWARNVVEGHSATDVDSLLLDGWLGTRDLSLTPLEYTLKVWSAYAGDARGPDGIHAIEAYLRRMTTTTPNGRAAIERLAMQVLAAINPTITIKEAENWVSEFEQQEAAPAASASSAAEGSKASAPKPPSVRVIPSLVSIGLLISRTDGRLSLVHPVITGYLAGRTLASTGGLGAVQSQSDWIGKTLAVHYFACFGDVSNLLNTILSQRDDPLRRAQLTAARWLRSAPKNLAWRSVLMRHLVNSLYKEFMTLGLGARYITALVLSGDANVPVLFRQLMKSEHANLRLLAALGCGLAHDTKAIEDLTGLANDQIPAVARAAILCLTTLGTKSALDNVVTILLQGSDDSRRAAAEALATNPTEGHPTLQDGAQMDDLLVRHAVVYGLARVNQPWAVQILEKMAIEDGQWVVRNAAAQMLEELKQLKSSIPRLPPPLADTPWLIEYAAKLGMGVTAGKPATDLLVQVLKDGNDIQRLLALEYMRLYGADEAAIIQIFHNLYGSLGERREAAFNTLWHIGASGVNIPSPMQFGLGA